MIHSIIYEEQNSTLKTEILRIGRENSHCMVKLWSIFDCISDLEKRVILSNVATEEELFTILTIKEYSDKECQLRVLDEKIDEAERLGYTTSIIDLLYFKGISITSHFHTISSYEARFNSLLKVKETLILKMFWGTNKGYDYLIEGMLCYFNNQREKSVESLLQAETRLLKEDYYATEIVYRHLMFAYLYLKKYKNSLLVAEKRINDKINFNDWSDFHVDLLYHSGDFGNIIEITKKYYHMIPDTKDVGERWNKLFFLYYLLKMATLLNDDKLVKEYRNSFDILAETFNTPPRYIVPLTAFYSLQMLDCYINDDCTIVDIFDRIYFLEPERDSLFIKYFKTIELVPYLIDYYIDKSMFKETMIYIDMLPRGKGKGHEHNNELDFYYNYYISVIVSKTLDWQNYNISKYEGNQNQVAFRYLENIATYKDSLPIAMQLLYLIQKTKLEVLHGNIDSINIKEMKSYLYFQGFWKLQLIGMIVLYYSLINVEEEYKKFRTILINELSKYENYPIYQVWRDQLLRVLEDREKLDGISEIVSVKRKQHIEEIIENLDFIQRETQKALRSK